MPDEVNDIVQNVQGVHCELVGPGLEQRGENRFEEPTNRLPAFERAVRTDDDGVVCVISEDAIEIASAEGAKMVFEDLPSGACFSRHHPSRTHMPKRLDSILRALACRLAKMRLNSPSVCSLDPPYRGTIPSSARPASFDSLMR